MCGVPGSATGCAGILCVRIPARYGCFPAVGLNSRGPNTLARLLDGRSLAGWYALECGGIARWNAVVFTLECGGIARWNAVVLHAGMRWYFSLECCGIVRGNAVVLYSGMRWHRMLESCDIVHWPNYWLSRSMVRTGGGWIFCRPSLILLLSVGVHSLLEDRVGAIAGSFRFNGTYGIMNRLHCLFFAAQLAQ
jgi:hypothetical protein